jgi:hypothetical protein
MLPQACHPSDRMIAYVKLRPALDSEVYYDGVRSHLTSTDAEQRVPLAHLPHQGHAGSVLGNRIGHRRTGSYQESNLGAGDQRPSHAEASCSAEAGLGRLHELGWPRGKEKFSLGALLAPGRVSRARPVRGRGVTCNVVCPSRRSERFSPHRFDIISSRPIVGTGTPRASHPPSGG